MSQSFFLILAGIVAVFAAVILLFVTRGGSTASGAGAVRPQTAGRGMAPRLSAQAAGASKAKASQAPQVVEIACAGIEAPNPMREMTDVDKVVMDLIEETYDIPSAVVELSTLLQDPETGARKVAEYASTDPVLSAMILRAANSPAFGRSGVKSLPHAVTYLGFNQIWLIANQLMADRSLRHVMTIRQEELLALWRHSAFTAACARHILLGMGLAGDPLAPVTITSALFHDVGKFFLKGIDPEARVANDGPPILGEIATYGMDHCRIGLLLATHWGLPEQISTLVAYHHHAAFANLEEIPASLRRYAAIITLSDHVARLWEAEETPGIVVYAMPEPVFFFTGLAPPAHLLLTRQLRHELRTTAKVIEEAQGR